MGASYTKCRLKCILSLFLVGCIKVNNESELYAFDYQDGYLFGNTFAVVNDGSFKRKFESNLVDCVVGSCIFVLDDEDDIVIEHEE